MEQSLGFSKRSFAEAVASVVAVVVVVVAREFEELVGVRTLRQELLVQNAVADDGELDEKTSLNFQCREAAWDRGACLREAVA